MMLQSKTSNNLERGTFVFPSSDLWVTAGKAMDPSKPLILNLIDRCELILRCINNRKNLIFLKRFYAA
jgi:hypothetical protein